MLCWRNSKWEPFGGWILQRSEESNLYCFCYCWHKERTLQTEQIKNTEYSADSSASGTNADATIHFLIWCLGEWWCVTMEIIHKLIMAFWTSLRAEECELCGRSQILCLLQSWDELHGFYWPATWYWCSGNSAATQVFRWTCTSWLYAYIITLLT